MNRRLYILLFLLLAPCSLLLAQVRVNQDGSNAALYNTGDSYYIDSQNGSYVDGAGNRTTWGRDTTKFKNKKDINPFLKFITKPA